MSSPPAHALSIAPMLDRTDRHFRYMMRQITRRTMLYSEMVTTGAILRGERHRHLAFHPMERPLALQLGGDDPAALAQCSRIAADYGYDEINLNVGCPSPRVQRGNFGACLMAEPERVAACVAAMAAACTLPVSVKHRIGIDAHDSYDFMARFVDTVAAAGCAHFIVHARIALLNGLSPKANRRIPPLRYADVYRLKDAAPHLTIVLNGGVCSLDEATNHHTRVDGVMIGRAAYEDPFLFAAADQAIFGATPAAGDRLEVVAAMIPYAASHLAGGGRLSNIARHMLQLFAGQPGARRWRRLLSEEAMAGGAVEVLQRGLDAMATAGNAAA